MLSKTEGILSAQYTLNQRSVFMGLSGSVKDLIALILWKLNVPVSGSQIYHCWLLQMKGIPRKIYLC